MTVRYRCTVWNMLYLRHYRMDCYNLTAIPFCHHFLTSQGVYHGSPFGWLNCDIVQARSVGSQYSVPNTVLLQVSEQSVIDFRLIAWLEVDIENQIPMTLSERTIFRGHKVELGGHRSWTRFDLCDIDVAEGKAGGYFENRTRNISQG